MAEGEGRSGSIALACETTNTTVWCGASQTIPLNRTNVVPLVLSGWSKAEAVSGGTDSDYSLYVDILYQDGTPLWGQTAQFSVGTHDWQQRQITIYPEKPVKNLTLHCLFRNHSGKVWFDDLKLEELTAQAGAFIFQGTPMVLVPLATSLPKAEVVRSTSDGLSLGFAGSQVVSVEVEGRELATNSPGGFLVRDVAASSDVFGFTNGVCSELDLSLETTVTESTNHVSIQGRIKNLRQGDRAVLLLFALPVDASGWRWGDDIRRQRTIQGSAEFTAVTSVGCGTTGAMSLYPLSVVENGNLGLSLALDMAFPAVLPAGLSRRHAAVLRRLRFRTGAGDRALPGRGGFPVCAVPLRPALGLPAALQKLQAIFPDYFTVRSRDQGIWMPFTDISTVQGWQDFGFRYQEGNNNAVRRPARHPELPLHRADDLVDADGPDVPRTVAEALRVRDE